MDDSHSEVYKPKPRFYHTSFVVEGVTHVWGGLDDHYQLPPPKCLEAFDGVWKEILLTGDTVIPLQNGVLAATQSTIYHYAAEQEKVGFGTHSSLHSMEVGEWAWRRVPVNNERDAPVLSDRGGMVAHGSQLIVVAGQTRGSHSKLKVFDTMKGTWSTPRVTGTPPPACWGFSFDLFNDHCAVLYGGRTGKGCNEDAYILDISCWHWSRVTTQGSSGPKGRWLHGTCIIPGRAGLPLLLVVGGIGGLDSWVLDLQSHRWTKVTLPPGVEDRSGHTVTVAWVGSSNVLVVVHGGLRKMRAIADTTIVHFAVDSTSGATPGLEVVDVVASEWGPHLFNTGKRADLVRWREKANFLHDLARVKVLIETKSTIPVRPATIVFVGIPRSGKTTLFRRMEDPSVVVVPGEMELPSTAMAKQPVPVVIKKPSSSVATVHQSQLVRQSFHDEKLYLSRHSLKAISAMATDIQRQHQQPRPTPLQAAHSDNTERPHPFPGWRFFRRRKHSPSPTGPSRPSSGRTDSSSGATAQEKPPPSFQSADDIIAEALQSGNLDRLASEEEQCTLLHILDTGGQPELSEAVSRLLSGPAIYLLTIRLCDSLDRRFLIRHLSPDGEQSEPYLSSFTVEEVVFQALSCISHMSAPPSLVESPNTPSVTAQSATLLVGTHKDLVSDDVIRSIDETLQRKMKESSLPTNTIIRYPNPDWNEDKTKPPFKLVIPIDNTSPSDPGLTVLGQLINDILEKHFPTVDVPASWLFFLQSLRSTGAKVLSLGQCVKIAEKCGIQSEEEVRLALWYLTQKFGTIRYYAHVKGMEGIVIIDVQLLFDGSTCLISTSFRRGKACSDVEVRFQKTGRCPVGEAENLIGCEGDIPPAQLLLLFESVRLLTPVEDENGKVIEYFVPTVLPSCEVESLPQPTSPAPLLFTFSTGFCPTGHFNAVVVHLSSPRLQSELKWRLFEDELFRNKINFHVGEDFDKVSLISRPTLYEVWIERKAHPRYHLPLPQVCNVVRSTVYEAIAAVKSSPTSSLSIAHHTAFYCCIEGCHSAAHPAVPEAAHALYAVCSFTGKPSPLSPEQTIWYGDTPKPVTMDREAQAILQRPPREIHSVPTAQPGLLTMDDFRTVHKALWDVRYKWWAIGVELGLRLADLENIRAKHGKDFAACLDDLVTVWLTQAQPIAMWAALVSALKDLTVGEEGVAEDIALEYLRA